MLALHLLREFKADIHYRHAELLFVVNAIESQRLHFLRVACIGRKMEYARAFAIVYVAFAIEAASTARDREMHVLLARLRIIQSLKRA